MKIAYVSMYVNDLDKMKDFFVKYFKATVNDKYENFQSGYTYCTSNLMKALVSLS